MEARGQPARSQPDSACTMPGQLWPCGQEPHPAASSNIAIGVRGIQPGLDNVPHDVQVLLCSNPEALGEPVWSRILLPSEAMGPSIMADAGCLVWLMGAA